jgi:acyl-CoA carboxylase subunit beta
MVMLASHANPRDPDFIENRAANEEALHILEEELAKVRAGGGEASLRRHRARGRMLPRERIEFLVDPDEPLLELSPLAAYGTRFATGATIVTAIGIIEGRACVLLAHDPTIHGGTINPYTHKKQMRALEIARTHRLPIVFMVESGGADLLTQSELLVPGGAVFRELTQCSAEGIPTISLVFGNATAGGAYVPAMCDYVVMIEQQSHVYLAGPPLVKMATGEDAEDEPLGGAAMHGEVSGLSDYIATDEMDALRLCREIVSHLPPGPRAAATDFDEPAYPTDELLGIAVAHPRKCMDMKEVIARLVDGSEFAEFKPAYGARLVTGWGAIHGRSTGFVANNGILFSEEAEKATQFIQLCNQTNTPIVFLQNTTGFMVGTDYEQGGITKHGAKMINAVANSKVPHVTVFTSGSYGAGNYAMSGRAMNPKLLFAWPNSRTAVMGAEQLAGVISIVRRQSAAARGLDFDEAEDARLRGELEQQIDQESTALFNTSLVYDDGIIDPRDTRTILALSLGISPPEDFQPSKFGVFRM